MEFGVLGKTLDTKVEIHHVYLGSYYSFIHDIRGQFGVVVLSLAWMPGIVAVIHMLAFYR